MAVEIPFGSQEGLPLNEIYLKEIYLQTQESPVKK